MKSHYTAVIERCLKTGLFVGYIPGLPGAHSQGETPEELQSNLKEVLELLVEDAPPMPAAEYVGTQTVALAR